jgi:hypothetical protein
VKLGRERRRIGTSILDLIEDAIALLRRAPAAAHLAYYVGAVPFWLGLLYFLSDMSQDAFAASRVLDASLGVAVLYLWKKVWQVVSAAQLQSVLTGRPDEPWTPSRVWRVFVAQASLQPWGLLVRPIAAVLTLPVVWVSAFFQNVTMVGDGRNAGESTLGRAWQQALLWPLQAHGIVSILTFFSFFVWLNFCIALALGPQLLKTFFGIETDYTRSMSAYLNTTFFTASVALTSLAVDPLRKAIFVIRCFQGAALHTGEDLGAELRQIRAKTSRAITAVAVLVLLLGTPAIGQEAPSPMPAAKIPATANAIELERRIGEVLERREYAWRAPRAKEAPGESQSWIARWFKGVGKKIGQTLDTAFGQLGRLWRWLRGLLTPNVSTGNASIDWFGLAEALAALLAIVAVVAIVTMVFSSVARRRKPAMTTAVVATAPPDLRSENLVADQLPEDGWRELAREYAARGELVFALRAAWLAGLAHLGRRELIGIARYKSNREYGRELRRRARERPPLLGAFDDNLRAFERSWYGKHEVSREGYAKFEENLDQIRTS